MKNSREGKSNRNKRLDHQSGHRMQFEKNRKKILASQTICAICGQPVDKSLKFPDPFSATVDHIIPLSKGGHPSDIDNLQLAHLRCNRLKWDRIKNEKEEAPVKTFSSTDKEGLPLLIDWTKYRSQEDDESNSDQLYKEAESIRRKGKNIYARGIE